MMNLPDMAALREMRTPGRIKIGVPYFLSFDNASLSCINVSERSAKKETKLRIEQSSVKGYQDND